MKMSGKINIDKLIEAVRLKEFLWKTSDPDYRDTQAKAEEWDKISAKFGVPADQCRRKWKCLRDAYRRELRKLNADAEPDGDNNLPKWRFYSRLEFLQETVKPFVEQSKIRAKAAAALADSGMEVQNDVNGFEEDVPFSPIVQAYFPKTEYVTPHNEQPHSSPLQPRVDDGPCVVKEEFIKTMKFVQQYLSDSNRTCPAALLDDEDELFCRSMLCKLKRFPLPAKNMIKMQIMALLNREEENLMNTTSETNHST